MKNVIKFSLTVTLLLIVVISCEKDKLFKGIKLVNGTDTNVSVIVGDSVEAFNGSYHGMKAGMIEYDEGIDLQMYKGSSVIFGYKDKFYIEQSISSKRSIMNLDNYVNIAQSNGVLFIYFISEDYILSLPEVEMPTEN